MKQNIKNIALALAMTTATVAGGSAAAQGDPEWRLLWTTSDLPNPEGVTYDRERNVLFFSNQYLQGDPGAASIGQMTLNGAVIEQDWVSGLNEPKGIAINGNKLFVSDVTELVEIDIAAGEIVNRYPGPDAKFLNDVVIDDDGNVYVSDMFISAIYKLDTDGNFGVWLQDPVLENPNGILIDDGSLILASWGGFSDGNPMAAPDGGLVQVSLADKSITKLSAETFGNLDGLQKLGDDGYLVSDWIAGGVLSWSPETGALGLIDTPQSSGDIAYVADQEVIYVPMALQGEVRAYGRVNPDRDLGVRRDGSYYTRLEWTNATLDTPLYWAGNLNDDDTARNGGSWGAPTTGPAEAILSFFGEPQTVKRIKLFHNVGATISPLDELAKSINIYVSNDSDLQRIGDKDADLSQQNWQKVIGAELEQREGWFEFVLDEPVEARYVRLELVENFGTPPDRPFTETNEIKLYAK